MYTCLAMLTMSAILLLVVRCWVAPEGGLDHRTGTITVHARPGTRVEVMQLEHEFWFGTAINASMFRPGADPHEQEHYLRVLKENFNCVVHENALKWYATEREQGMVSYKDVDRMLEWAESNGMRTRGHCLLWAVPGYVQDWVKALGDADLRRHIERRIRGVVGRCKGRIIEYDVNNEMLHGAYYADRLGRQVRADMFSWAHEEAPDAPLYVNDYNILSGGDLDRYEEQIEWLLAEGAHVGGIGCQGHFDENISMTARSAREALDRLARFGLPIRITEFDINTKDEEAKARGLEELYRICWEHPAVEGVLMWGFWEGRHWRPDAALGKRAWSPTPAAETYRRLVYDQWWTRWSGEADADGMCRVPAVYGRHRISAADQAQEVVLGKSAREATVDFTD